MAIQDNYTDSNLMGDLAVKQMMDHSYEGDYLINASFQREAMIDKRFKVGDQNLSSMLYGDSQYFNQRSFSFNLIRRNVNMIAGYQRQHRKSGALVGVEDKDQILANDWTQLSMWSERREGFHEYFSQAFEGAVDVGLSLLQMYNDYTMDPVSGDLICDNISYNNFIMDSWFRKQDLSDCNYIWRRRWVSKQRAKNLLPGRAKEIDRMRPDGFKDSRFPIQAESLSSQSSDLFTYDEYHYLDTRLVTIVVDTKTGETMEWEENPDDSKDELERTLSQMPWLKVKKIQKPTVKLAIVLGGKVMYHGQNLLNVDRYPFVPVLCYHEPDLQNYSNRFMGVVRNLRDAQYLYSRRRVIELDILESQINSGYKFKVGSVTDEKCFRQKGQGFLIPIDANAEMSDVERIEAPGIPASMIELSRSLAEDITKISGISEELLGVADDDSAGILAMARQGANLVTLQTIFDKADYSQKLYTSLRMEAIRKNWSNGKIRNILGRDPDPRLRLTNTQKFDIAVEQGVYSTTQKELELKQLLYFRSIGVNITDQELVSASSMQNKDKTLERMDQEAQAQQQQTQQMAQSQEEQASNQRMIDFAKAKKDMAGARDLEANTLKKFSEIDENEASAEEKRTQAELNLVKQLIELEDLDLKQFKESLLLAEYIKNMNATNSQQNQMQNQQNNPMQQEVSL
jgi:hypothetical protein